MKKQKKLVLNIISLFIGATLMLSFAACEGFTNYSNVKIVATTEKAITISEIMPEMTIIDDNKYLYLENNPEDFDLQLVRSNEYEKIIINFKKDDIVFCVRLYKTRHKPRIHAAYAVSLIHFVAYMSLKSA